MSIRVALVLLPLIALAGCAGALAERRQHDAEGAAIERAYAARDTDTLEKSLHDSEWISHTKLARDYLLMIRITDFRAMTCGELDAAFQPIETTGDDGGVRTSPNPKLDFAYVIRQIDD